VLRRCLTIFEHEICVGASADHDGPIERKLLARVGSFDDLEVQFARHGAAAYSRQRSVRNWSFRNI
jgi:hypothetical protein